MFWRPASSPSAASPLPGRVACSDSSDNGLSPPTICGSIDAPVTGLLIGLPVSRAAASTVAAEGCGGTGMTIRPLSPVGGAADMSAASAGRMTATEVRTTAANETAASTIGLRSAMIDHLEELMLRIDPDRRGVAGLVAETMQNVVDPLWSRIDDDIDRPRRIAADGGAEADRVSELPHCPIERPVPRHRH